MRGRPIVDEIPEHLQPYIVRQDASFYTAIDHASWRFILKISRGFFAQHAHKKYLDGLRETGISTDRIPLISEMDQCIRKFGWRCVGISGFIPPAVFMEFLSLGILPIACDMRKLENLSYTPAPDIVHEAAGHAPIIADPEYAEYLRSYGEISQKAIYSKHDLDVYEGIRALSDIKENPKSAPEQIESAQKQLDRAIAAIDHVSEATELARMSWWTIEYGMVGSLDDPKIYGAGLLSSLGESYNCIDPSVHKIAFDLSCIKQTYDITRPQPQLYVAPDFQTLIHVLQEFGETLAFKRGGVSGLNKAKMARVATTSVLDSGIQISGVLADYLSGTDREPIYLKFSGPCQLSHRDRELKDQGSHHHPEGFGTPVGKLRGGKSPSQLSRSDLEKLGFKSGAQSKLEFESGVTVEGVLISQTAAPGSEAGENLLLTFKDCTVKYGAQTLFQPEWGSFDMACGTRVISVFGGAADRVAYLKSTGGYRQPPGTPKSNLTDENRELEKLYLKVREIRTDAKWTPSQLKELDAIQDEIGKRYPSDWLLRYELLEVNTTAKLNASWASSVRAQLEKIAAQSKEKSDMISRGLALL